MTCMTLGKNILNIQSILDGPNPDIFLNEKVAKLHKKDRKKYKETTKEYTVKYAKSFKFWKWIKQISIEYKAYLEKK